MVVFTDAQQGKYERKSISSLGLIWEDGKLKDIDENYKTFIQLKNILFYFNKFIDDLRAFDPEYIFYSFITESNFKIKIAYKLDIALIRIEEAKPTKTVFIPFKDKIKIKIAKRKIKIIKFLNKIKYILG